MKNTEGCVMSELEKLRIIKTFQKPDFVETSDVISAFIYHKNDNYEELKNKYANINPCEKSFEEVAEYLLSKYHCKPATNEKIIEKLSKQIYMNSNFPEMVDFYIFRINDVYFYMDINNEFYQIEAEANSENGQKLANEIILYKGISEEDISAKNHKFLLYTMIREGISI